MSLRSRKAQSILEYATVGALVIVGIIVMGPYVIRSINAHFKLWDEQVVDSHSEPLLQAPPIHAPNVPPCDCRLKPSGLACGAGGCPPTHKLVQYECSPQGCSQPDVCVADSACCSTMVKTEYCGKTPLPVTTPIPPNPTRPQRCHYGFRLYEGICGENDPRFSCVPDHTTTDGDPSCDPVCSDHAYHATDPHLPADVTAYFCPGDDTGLLQDLPLAAVPALAQCTARKCEIYCREGHEVVGNRCVLECDESEIAAYSNTAIEAGGSQTHTTDFVIDAVEYSVEVWTEDLNFTIVFHGPDDRPQLWIDCPSAIATSTGTFTPSDIVCGRDTHDDGQINHYTVRYTAHRAVVTVTEGGRQSSDSLGYRITAKVNCPACPGNEVFVEPDNIPSPITPTCASRYEGTNGNEYWKPDRATADHLCQLMGYPSANRFDVGSFDDCGNTEDDDADATTLWNTTTSTWDCAAPCTYPQTITRLYCCAGNTGWNNGSDCSSLCGSLGMLKGRSPEGMECASGENRPPSGEGIINYDDTWGGMAGPGNDASERGSYCYESGQKRDGDDTDLTVACWCRYNF